MEKDLGLVCQRWRSSRGRLPRELRLVDVRPEGPAAETETFWAIVDANRTSEDAELADVLDECGNLPAVTLRRLIEACRQTKSDLAPLNAPSNDLAVWLADRKNSRVIPHRMKTAGYVPFRNAAAKDGLWKIEGRRQVVYVQQSLSVPERQVAAAGLARRGG